MALTKTQQKVLDEVMGGQIMIDTGTFNGRSFGRRMVDAAEELVTAGMLRRVNISELTTGKGRIHVYTTYTYEVVK